MILDGIARSVPSFSFIVYSVNTHSRIVPFAFSLLALLGSLFPGAPSLQAQKLQEELDLFGPQPPSNHVFEARVGGFSVEEYSRAVSDLIALREQVSGSRIARGKKGKVGLKVYSDSGPGLSTPEALVEAVVRKLESRGYERSEIFILGLNTHTLRQSGFLPPLSARSVYFNHVFVRSLDSGLYYHEKWFYDSPLPAQSTEYWVDLEAENPFPQADGDTIGRKSYLPIPLMHEVDFWINLPCYSDHPVLGVNGALLNATLWNASNTTRFFKSPATAPVAVAEMAAIPELRETWVLNIASLERYQYVGGPIFNAGYMVSEPVVLLSDNPVMLDSLMAERLNAQREKNGFAPLAEDLKILAFSEQLGLGEGDLTRMNLIRAN